MSGCNCKKGVSSDKTSVNEDKLPSKTKALNFVVRFLVFLIFLVISPAIYVYTLWIAFNGLVLSKSLNVNETIKLLAKFSKKNIMKEEEDDDVYAEEFDSLSEDDVVLTNVEDITGRYGR